MGSHLGKVDERNLEEIDPIALKAAVIEAAEIVRDRSEPKADGPSIEEMLADPAIARWMPPYKYGRPPVTS
ncbi:MAG: hypothetical protein WAN43_11535 [Rhodomicrobium sp.]